MVISSRYNINVLGTLPNIGLNWLSIIKIVVSSLKFITGIRSNLVIYEPSAYYLPRFTVTTFDKNYVV